MVSQGNKRPPRQPLSAEEVRELVQLKKLRQYFKIEKFKKTRNYKILNSLNIAYMILFTEIIVSFLGSANSSVQILESVKVYYGKEIIDGKRIISSAEFKTTEGALYDVGINDVCEMPKAKKEIVVGRDWLLRKDVKINFESSSKDYYVKRSFPLLFISILMGLVTCVLFAYNFNQDAYSLKVITFVNSLAVIAFLLL